MHARTHVRTHAHTHASTWLSTWLCFYITALCFYITADACNVNKPHNVHTSADTRVCVRQPWEQLLIDIQVNLIAFHIVKKQKGVM